MSLDLVMKRTSARCCYTAGQCGFQRPLDLKWGTAFYFPVVDVKHIHWAD